MLLVHKILSFDCLWWKAYWGRGSLHIAIARSIFSCFSFGSLYDTFLCTKSSHGQNIAYQGPVLGSALHLGTNFSWGQFIQILLDTHRKYGPASLLMLSLSSHRNSLALVLKLMKKYWSWNVLLPVSFWFRVCFWSPQASGTPCQEEEAFRVSPQHS